MSILETIFNRAMNEPDFAHRLFADPDRALSGYDLSPDELTQIKSISQAQFNSMVIEERKSFASTVRGSGYFQVRDEGG